jgi:mRNA interferase HigB
VRLVGRDLIDAFAREHSGSRSALERWTRIIEANSFRHLADLKKAFRSADYVKPYTVFNVAGNRYRLSALIDYALGIVTVTHMMTHEEYDEQR